MKLRTPEHIKLWCSLKLKPLLPSVLKLKPNPFTDSRLQEEKILIFRVIGVQTVMEEEEVMRELTFLLPGGHPLSQLPMDTLPQPGIEAWAGNRFGSGTRTGINLYIMPTWIVSQKKEGET